MSRFLEMLRFELGYYLTRLSTWVYFLITSNHGLQTPEPPV